MNNENNIIFKEVRNNLIYVITKTLESIKNKEFLKLEIISNYTIHTSTTFQQEDSIEISIIIYSLFKLYNRYLLSQKTKFFNLINDILPLLKENLKHLEKNNIYKYRYNTHRIIEILKKYDKNISNYIQDILLKAKIKKGSKLYEHGLSLGKISDFLGITEWELQNYIGKIKTNNEKVKKEEIKSRLNYAREIFK